MARSGLRKLAVSTPLNPIYSVGEGRTVVIGLDGCRECRNAFAQWLRDGQQPDDRIVAAIAGGANRHTRSSSLTSIGDVTSSSQNCTNKGRAGDVGDVLRQATKAPSGKATAVVKNTVIVPGIPLDDHFSDWDKKSRSALLKLATIGSQEMARFEAVRLPSAGQGLSFARSLVDCCHSVEADLLLIPAHDCSALLPFLPSLPLSSASPISAFPPSSVSSASAATAKAFASADSRMRRVASFCSENAPCPVTLIGRVSSFQASASGRESCGGSARDCPAGKDNDVLTTGANENFNDVQECSSSNGDSSNEDGDGDREFYSSSSSGSNCTTSITVDSIYPRAPSLQSLSQVKPIMQVPCQLDNQGKRSVLDRGFFLIRAGLKSRTIKQTQVRQMVRRWSGGEETKREATFRTSRGLIFSVSRGMGGVASVG